MNLRPFSNNDHVVNFLDAGASRTRGKIRGNGQNNISYDTSSDRRLKKNVRDMPSCWDLVKNLHARKFEWKDDDRTDVGFIAQEVYDLPGFATMKPCRTSEEDDPYYSCCKMKTCVDSDGYCPEPVNEDGSIYAHMLDYGQFTPYLWKALGEAIARIETLEAKVRALENPTFEEADVSNSSVFA